MKERDFQVVFGHWLRARWHGTGVFELKLTKTGSLPFSAVKTHQEAALLAANEAGRGLYFKIPDAGYINPFDCIFLRETPAFVVVRFYKRGGKVFYMIPIGAWIQKKNSSKRKSLTENEAINIGIRCEL